MSLLRQIRQSQHERSGGNEVFYTPVLRTLSLVTTYLLYKANISPNTISFLSFFCYFIVGLYCAHFSLGSAYFLPAIIVLGYVLDCSDGEISRLKSMSSLTGHSIDILAHTLGSVSLLYGLSHYAAGLLSATYFHSLVGITLLTPTVFLTYVFISTLFDSVVLDKLCRNVTLCQLKDNTMPISPSSKIYLKKSNHFLSLFLSMPTNSFVTTASIILTFIFASPYGHSFSLIVLLLPFYSVAIIVLSISKLLLFTRGLHADLIYSSIVHDC